MPDAEAIPDDPGSTAEERSAGPISPAELGDLVSALARQLRHRAARAYEPLGLTPGAARALRVISRYSSPDGEGSGIRMGDLARRLAIVPRSATGAVAALEAAGLVERTTDPRNRRSVRATLTGRGQSVQRDLAAARAGAADELFGEFSPGQRGQLAALVNQALGSSHRSNGRT